MNENDDFFNAIDQTNNIELKNIDFLKQDKNQNLEVNEISGNELIDIRHIESKRESHVSPYADF